MEIVQIKKNGDYGLTSSTRTTRALTTLSGLHDPTHIISTRVVFPWFAKLYHIPKYALDIINVPMVVS
jgi:hypothetical protein